MPVHSNRYLGGRRRTFRTVGGVAGLAYVVAGVMVCQWLGAADWVLTVTLSVTPVLVFWVNRAELVDRFIFAWDRADAEATQAQRVREIERRDRIQARYAAAAARRTASRAPQSPQSIPDEPRSSSGQATGGLMAGPSTPSPTAQEQLEAPAPAQVPGEAHAAKAPATPSDILERQLGRADRLMAKRGVKRLPSELLEDETLECVAVGVIPRTHSKEYFTKSGEFAVLAATDLRLLVVSGRRCDTIEYATMTAVKTGSGPTGDVLTIARKGSGDRVFKSVSPVPAGATRIATAIKARIPN